MNGRRKRVLVVDDSRLLREMLGDTLGSCAEIEVVGAAADGRQALDMVTKLRPDVVTLDVEMPQMNGLETLERMLETHPVPVIMVSALTRPGAMVTLDALDRGALDYIAKPDHPAQLGGMFREELLRKILAIAGTDVARVLRFRRERAARRKASGGATTPAVKPVVSRVASQQLGDKCVAIGISTGGPPALSTLFEAFEPPMPPVVVVQHMPANFTGPFAWRLNTLSKLTVKEAASGDVLEANHAYIAPGGKHLTLRTRGQQVVIQIRDGEPVSGHRPSVDVMMQCVAEIYGPRALGVVMTGMGRDGSDGCKYIRQAGGYVLGQDPASSDVYGMNKVAYVEGNVDRQFSLDEGATLIQQQVRRLGRATAGAAR